MVVSVLLAGAGARAQDDFGFSTATEASGGGKAGRSEAALISEVSALAPGQPFTVALQLKHLPGWHSYYVNSANVEDGPSISWKLPEGFQAGPIQWPVPELITMFDEPRQSYSGEVALLVEITPAVALEVGSTITLEAHAQWQICEEVCINEDGKFLLELPVAAAAVPDPARADWFAAARARQPVPPTGWKLSATREGATITLRATPPSGTALPATAAFVATDRFLGPVFPAPVQTEDGALRLSLPIKEKDAFGQALTIGKTLSGQLVLEGGQALTLDAVPLEKAPAPPLPWGKFLGILVAIFFGGLILNLMPCVFPVIGLKIMGFAQQSGQDQKKIILHGLLFTLGVLLSFWLLSGILLAVRESSGADIGWGYQLQNKWFVWGLVMLFLVFGLAMFGVFEFGASATTLGGNLQHKEGLSGTFFSGALATVAATPCSAPILGPAIGTAVTLPAWQFFLAFTVMALGLALPYLLLSAFPRLTEKLPRPGPWMESFKQALAFLLFGAAGYFYWVYSAHIDPDVLYLVIIGFVMVALAFWIFGRWGPMAPVRRRWIARAFALAIGAAGVYATTGPSASDEITWEPWSEARVQELREEGTPVYIDFTARWCATCQQNKKVAYTKEVRDLIKQRGIVLLKADKTKPDPAIEAALAALGRAAIPVNVLYVPGQDDPIITPEVLTPGYLTDLFTNQVSEEKK